MLEPEFIRALFKIEIIISKTFFELNLNKD